MDTKQTWRFDGAKQIEKAYGDEICITEPYPEELVRKAGLQLLLERVNTQ